MDIAVVGGDPRQAKLADLLMRDGHSVRCFALERAGERGLRHEPCLKMALEGAKYVILPLPALRDGMVSAGLSGETLPARELVEALEPDQVILAGKTGGALADLASERGLVCADYFAREELTVKNAAITAEGAVEILMRELPVTLLGSRVLVIGFGRIGKLLSLRLQALGAKVTASARKPGDFAWMEALGISSLHTERLDGELARFDAVVNTVPAMVLTEARLRQLREGCLCLDLASRPGGIDMDAAKSLGVRAIWALSLPGLAAPETAAAAVRDAVYNIIYELECGTWRG